MKKSTEIKEIKKLKITLVCLVLFVIAAVFLVAHIVVSPTIVKPDKIISDIFLVLSTTLISIIVVAVAYTIYTEFEFKKNLRETIIASLSGEDEILSKYNTKSVTDIIKNSLKFILGTNLSRNFITNVLEKQLNSISYRTNYKYNVYIKKSDTPEKNIISQSIEYKKHLKIKNRKNIEVSCFFTLKEDPFRENPPKNVIFFREELTCEDFFNNSILSNASNANTVISALNFKFSIFYNNKFIPIQNSDVKVEVINSKMVMFTTKVPQKWITNEEDKFLSFSCKITCEYPTNKNNYFYVVFPEPMQDALFSINFDEEIIRKENVNHVSFVLNPNYEIRESPNTNGFEFGLKHSKKLDNNTIFPHSGIVFHW